MLVRCHGNQFENKGFKAAFVQLKFVESSPFQAIHKSTPRNLSQGCLACQCTTLAPVSFALSVLCGRLQRFISVLMRLMACVVACSVQWDTAALQINILKPRPYRGRCRSHSTSNDNLAPWPHWKGSNMGNKIPVPLPPMLGRCKKQTKHWL